MKHIYFITTTKHKYDAFSQHVSLPGHQFEQLALETPEIQTESSLQVARFSADYMAKQLNHAVVREDVGHFIPSLHGFPGVYLKFIERQLGIEGTLRLLAGKPRQSYFELAVSYADPAGHRYATSSKISGHLADQPAGEGHLTDTLFIPDGEVQTIAQLRNKKMFTRPHDHYDRLKDFLVSLE